MGSVRGISVGFVLVVGLFLVAFGPSVAFGAEEEEEEPRERIEHLGGNMYVIGDEVVDLFQIKVLLRKEPYIYKMLYQGEQANNASALMLPLALGFTAGGVIFSAFGIAGGAVPMFVCATASYILGAVLFATGIEKKRKAIQMYNATVLVTPDSMTVGVAFAY